MTRGLNTSSKTESHSKRELLVVLSFSECLHGLTPAPFLLSLSVFLFLVFPVFFVSVPCARLSWPFRQLLSGRKYIVSYRIIITTVTTAAALATLM